MVDITPIDEYRHRRGRPAKSPPGMPKSPRGRSAGEPIFDVEEILRQLEEAHIEMARRLLDVLEEAMIDRLDQIRRFGVGLSRCISLALARRVEHEGLRDYVCEQAKNPKLELRRSLYLRMLQVPLTLEGQRNPAASAYLILHRAEGMITMVIAAVKESGALAKTRLTLRRPCATAYWSRDAVDQFLRGYLRELFEELETAGEVRPGS